MPARSKVLPARSLAGPRPRDFCVNFLDTTLEVTPLSDTFWSPPQYAGGHCGITHVDRGALEWMWGMGCRSLLDVGCGPGGMVQAAQAMGFRAVGIDVDPAVYRQPGVLLGDLVVAPILLPAPADVVWSVEVAEHIPPAATVNYLDTLTANALSRIVMTASQMPGPLHVNVRPVSDWESMMGERGWVPAAMLLADLLSRSTMQREFLRETGRVYVRRP